MAGSMSVCLPACLYVCLTVCLSLCVSQPACRSVCLSACLPVCLSDCLSVSVCQPACLSVCLCLHPSVSACLAIPPRNPNSCTHAKGQASTTGPSTGHFSELSWQLLYLKPSNWPVTCFLAVFTVERLPNMVKVSCAERSFCHQLCLRAV